MYKLSVDKFISGYCQLSGFESWTIQDWNAFIHVCRSRSLTASFYTRMELIGKSSFIPERMLPLFESSVTFAHAQRVQTRTQGKKLLNLLWRKENIPFVFLKGAAYSLGNTANAAGRLMTDIDICVKHIDINKAESALTNAGFKAKEMDEHDEKYYREWSHEIPPLVHFGEGVALDVHHTLLPPVSGRIISIEKLLSSVDVDGDDDSFPVPPTSWLVLHSTIHLILNEDVDNGLRDLTDVFSLLSDTNNPSVTKETAKLFGDEGFTQEWLIISDLLTYFFGFTPPAMQTEKKSLKSKLRCYTLRHSLIPVNEFLRTPRHRFARSLNYLLGYSSKMPPSVLFKQFSYKIYRVIAKALLGEYYFRPSKSDKGK